MTIRNNSSLLLKCIMLYMLVKIKKKLLARAWHDYCNIHQCLGQNREVKISPFIAIHLHFAIHLALKPTLIQCRFKSYTLYLLY